MLQLQLERERFEHEKATAKAKDDNHLTALNELTNAIRSRRGSVPNVQPPPKGKK